MVALCDEKLGTDLVIFYLIDFCMVNTVQFHNKLFRSAYKIHNVVTNSILAMKLVTIQLAITQLLPQTLLCGCLLLPKQARFLTIYYCHNILLLSPSTSGRGVGVRVFGGDDKKFVLHFFFLNKFVNPLNPSATRSARVGLSMSSTLNPPCGRTLSINSIISLLYNTLSAGFAKPPLPTLPRSAVSPATRLPASPSSALACVAAPPPCSCLCSMT